MGGTLQVEYIVALYMSCVVGWTIPEKAEPHRLLQIDWLSLDDSNTVFALNYFFCSFLRRHDKIDCLVESILLYLNFVVKFRYSEE